MALRKWLKESGSTRWNTSLIMLQVSDLTADVRCQREDVGLVMTQDKRWRKMVLGDCYAFSSENGTMANNAIKVSGVTLLEQMAKLDDKENARQAFGL